MTSLIDYALLRTRTVLSTLVLILVSGTVAYVEIAKEAEPNVNVPVVYVQISHEGISPEDAERLLIRPMEQKLRSIEGVKEMRATGYEGGANVTLEFDAGFDANKAMSDVREKVDLAKPDLPEETDEPTVHEVNFSMFPVLVVTLSGEVPERTLLKTARELKDSIEGIPSVLKTEIAGDREEMVEILIDPVKVESYGLTPYQAEEIVRKSNMLVAAGVQDTGLGRFSIKVPGLLETTLDIMNLPVKTSGDAVILLRDIAEVRRAFKDPETFAREGGRPAVALEVSKRTGENIIETTERVRQVVERERAAWPPMFRDAVKVVYSQDKSDKIRNMLSDLQNNIIAAVLLVMIVIVAALGPRTAGLVGVAIPGSFLAGILVIAALGMTINIVVLFSLTLAVGMLVDGAIVVTEYADRKMIAGEPRTRAYGLAAKRMAWPIITSTATTLAAFLPLLFWPGIVGEFMKFLPITLMATLTASLIMALIFIPTLGAQFGKAGAADPKTMAKIAAGEGGDLEKLGGLTGTYIHILKRALDKPGKIIALAVAILIAVQVIYAVFGKGIEFFPDVDPDFAKIQVRARGNLSIFEKDALMKQVEDRILAMDREKGEFKTVYTRVGREQQSNEAEDVIGTITLEFVDWRLRKRKIRKILAEVTDRATKIPGILVNVRKEEAGPPTGKPVQIRLSSRYPEILVPATAKVRAGFESTAGLTNIEDDRPLPGIDWVLRVDRAQAAKFNASVDLVGRAVQMVTAGIKLGEYRPDDADKEVDIRIRYPENYRTLDQLDNIRINTNVGRVPISSFVKRRASPRIGTINRADGRRIMAVKADVGEGVLVNDKVRELKAWLKNADLDPRIKTVFKGEDEEQKTAEQFLGKAFAVALFIMAIILVTQFNSFYSAFLVLTAVIMSTIGVFIGLLVTGQPFGIVMGGIGVIALAGIVVNNNIVLIDTFDRLHKTIGNTREAVLRTGAQRLRPVLLTTVTTMLGLMPMVLGLNIDFVTREVSLGAPTVQWWRQLSTAIVFGLGFATVLTLIVTPSLLMLRANVHDRVAGRGGWGGVFKSLT